MRRVGLLFGCAAALVPNASIAQDTQATAKTAQLSKVIFKPDIPKENQHIKVGTICLLAGTPLDFGNGERTASYERFERLFSATMKERGFGVISKSTNLFEGEVNTPNPDFLVGATYRPTAIALCDSVNGQKGSVSISVEWQIFDRSKQQVVETVITEGTGQIPKFQQSGIGQMFDQAFSDSVKSLIDKGVVQKYLGTPKS
jgi:hypothetical protein